MDPKYVTIFFQGTVIAYPHTINVSQEKGLG